MAEATITTSGSVEDVPEHEHLKKNADIYLTLKARGLGLEEIQWLESVRLYGESSTATNDTPPTSTATDTLDNAPQYLTPSGSHRWDEDAHQWVNVRALDFNPGLVGKRSGAVLSDDEGAHW